MLPIRDVPMEEILLDRANTDTGGHSTHATVVRSRGSSHRLRGRGAILRQTAHPGAVPAAADQGLRLRVRLLGHMAVDDHNGQILLPRTRKTRALLAVLAVASPKPMLRVQLAALLW